MNTAIHLENQRISFDAMRAYHQSEISHKAHAVDILKSILTASIFVYGGLFGLLLNEKDINLNIVQLAGFATIFINYFIASIIVKTTNDKIKEDNIQYCLHYYEYRKERELLGIEKYLEDANFTSKTQVINNKNIGQVKSNEAVCKDLNSNKESGHSHTQSILNTFSKMIAVICIVGTIGLMLLANNMETWFN